MVFNNFDVNLLSPHIRALTNKFLDCRRRLRRLYLCRRIMTLKLGTPIRLNIPLALHHLGKFNNKGNCTTLTTTIQICTVCLKKFTFDFIIIFTKFPEQCVDSYKVIVIIQITTNNMSKIFYTIYIFKSLIIKPSLLLENF